MNKIKIFTAIIFTVVQLAATAQCPEDKEINHHLYQYFIANYISFNVNQQVNRSDFSFNDYYYHNRLYVLDTGQYYPVYFRCLGKDSTISDYSLIEFKIDISTFISKTCEKMPLVHGPSPILNSWITTIGLIGIDPKTNNYVMISGNLFLDDIKDEYFSQTITREQIKNYVYYRYYNYSPKFYKQRRRCIFFESEFTVSENRKYTTYLKKYKVKIWKTKSGVHEQFKEIESIIIDKG